MISPVQSSRGARRRSSWVIGFCSWLVLVACSGTPEIPVDTHDDSGDDSGNGGNATDGGDDDGLDIDGGGEGPGPEPEPELPWTCGDGNLEPGELCDDGNTKNGDGCSKDCQAQDPDYECEPGEACVRVVECGNGRIEGEELCDDDNTDDDDGCSGDCSEIEDGYRCTRPGVACVLIPVCGNGLRERGEECDSGPITDPGCTACVQDDDYWCPVPGEPCIEFECGNGQRTPGEACDDGNSTNGDGCSNCTIDSGWSCLASGCTPPCGDTIVQPPETCDTGATNGQTGSGCSATCQKLPGFACDVGGGPCVASVCPNGVTEPGEGCDDNNTIAGDGCGPTCQKEPTITRPGPDFNPVVSQSCGDGLLAGSEECDDGNDTSGDGCDEDCFVEDGYDCDNPQKFPETVSLKVTYRDFKSRAANGGHPDFQWSPDPSRRNMPGRVCLSGYTKCEAAAGAACPANTCGHLDADGKPVHHLTGNASERGRVTNANTYALWYRDTNASSTTGEHGVIDVQAIESSLVLTRQGGETSDEYRFSSGAHFPLNAQGFGSTCPETDDNGATAPDCCGTGGSCLNRNFGFTSELRYFFQYKGGETLTFNGDDDVWVFVNGRHAVDIGGVHGQQWGRVVLGDDGDGAADDSNCSAHGVNDEPGACGLEPTEVASNTDSRFGLTKGGIYEIVLFHAERHTTASNFRLTLKGFLTPRSACTPECGDANAVLAPGEVCDDGPDNADNTYGVCNESCTARPICGDGTVQAAGGPVMGAAEICDDGFNLNYYSDVFPVVGCAPGCVPPPYCGDNSVQSAEEDCDRGSGNTGAYGGCNADCTWAPYCGDDDVQEDNEECDDGPNNVSYSSDGSGCGYDCQFAPWCGDGTRNGPEQCDLGVGNNTGEYGGCKENCTLAPRCGDKIKQANEQCDDGPIGSLACSPTCKKRQVVTR